MWLRPASLDPLYGPVGHAYGRFRLRRQFIPLRDGTVLPTGTDEITLLGESEAELAIVGIAHGSDLQTLHHRLKQWLQSEASRLVHRELDLRRQRREAGTEGGPPGADPRDWTAAQWEAFYASQEQRGRAMWDALEPRLREHAVDRLSPERAREYVERRIREVGEAPDPGAHVVQWWQLSLDEQYQRYALVERDLHELEAAHPELGDHLTDDTATSSAD